MSVSGSLPHTYAYRSSKSRMSVHKVLMSGRVHCSSHHYLMLASCDCIQHHQSSCLFPVILSAIIVHTILDALTKYSEVSDCIAGCSLQARFNQRPWEGTKTGESLCRGPCVDLLLPHLSSVLQDIQVDSRRYKLQPRTCGPRLVAFRTVCFCRPAVCFRRPAVICLAYT